MRLLRRLIVQTSGASAAEYGLILAIVGVALAASALALGQSVESSMDQSGDRIEDCGGAC